MTGFSHVDDQGAARMVDVSGKDVTVRTATAEGRVDLSPDCVALLRGDGMPKGDVLATARLAGIMGAKRTPDLVPLCHPIALHGVTVDLVVDDGGVEVTAVTIACLTVIDMTKAVDPRGTITGVRVLTKTGGKTGAWER